MSKIAAIGFGYWGKNIIRNLAELGVLRVICDVDPARERLVKEQYPGVEFTVDYNAVLAAPEVEAVAISVPAALHHNLARQALELGKDVFVEKPLALNVEDAQELVKLAAKHQRVLMVGHILRYHPAIKKLSELVNQGELGRLQYIYSNRLNMGKIRTEENILWSFAPHDISVILALLNEEPCAVSCHGSAYLHQDVVDVTNSNFLFPSGVSAHIFVSWLHPFKEQRLVVIGSEKMAVFDDTAENKLLMYPHKVEWKNRIPTAVKAQMEVVAIDSYEPLKAELEHFLKCIADRHQPITDGAEGLRVLRVLAACERAMADNRATDSPLALDDGKAKPYFAHETARVDEPCDIGEGTKVWHFTHIMKDVRIGAGCIFGQNCHVASGVVIGNNVKVQNNVAIYSGTVVEDDVFLGPSCVLTNVTNPRAQVNRHELYEQTLLRRGATIGANATVVGGTIIGRYAFVGAGAVVTKDIPEYALVLGNPARQVGWMSRHGHRLGKPAADGTMICPESGYSYREISPGILRCLDLDEDAPLPEDKAAAKRSYDSFKTARQAELRAVKNQNEGPC